MNVSVLGSTGSIGTQSLAVTDDLKGTPYEITVSALTGGKNIGLLEKQIRKYAPRIAAVPDSSLAADLRIRVKDTSTRVLEGEEGLCAAAAEPHADMVLAAISGFAGLKPTLRAIDAGKDIALANKETLVTAGHIVMEKIKRAGVRLLPVDSEHCAIFQCLQGERKKHIKKLLITASGGPFFGKKREELECITVEQALKHPNWSMGAKITIDSATLMNKGLEIIEAKWLFGVDIADIRAVIHRESIIHSMVEFTDNSILAQLSLPSMKHPIQYAFTYPARTETPDKALDLTQIGTLSFFEPDEETFSALALAKQAGKDGGIMPVVLNAANEVAVDAFLSQKIKFLQIADTVGEILVRTPRQGTPSLEEIFAADRETRRKTEEYLARGTQRPGSMC